MEMLFCVVVVVVIVAAEKEEKESNRLAAVDRKFKMLVDAQPHMSEIKQPTTTLFLRQ